MIGDYMKLKVNKVLKSGAYHVNFEVSDFTSEEIAKMESFGIPVIKMKIQNPNGTNNVSMGLTQIQPRFNAVFDNEQLANDYQNSVIEQIKSELEKLRQSQDKFTSTQQVEL
jgi:hypothetical protein